MASVFVLLEAFNRKEAAALGFFPCATASFCLPPQGRILYALAQLTAGATGRYGIRPCGALIWTFVNITKKRRKSYDALYVFALALNR